MAPGESPLMPSYMIGKIKFASMSVEKQYNILKGGFETILSLGVISNCINLRQDDYLTVTRAIAVSSLYNSHDA